MKADAGHVVVEKYISEVFGNWASFRPQYMIGSGNNKDCEEWFFDRKSHLLLVWAISTNLFMSRMIRVILNFLATVPGKYIVLVIIYITY